MNVNKEAPYVGLSAYLEAESKYFAGRNTEIAALRLKLSQAAVTILEGVDGVGRTSLLRAGLVARAADDASCGGVIYFDDWTDEDFSARLKGLCVSGLPNGSTETPLDRLLTALAIARGKRIDVILDRFDDFLHPRTITRARQTFLEELLAAIRGARSPGAMSSFILSVRRAADPRLQDLLRQLAPTPCESLELLDLDAAQARAAIVEPLRVHGEARRTSGVPPYGIEAQCVDAVLEGASGDGGRVQPAVLQIVLAKLWEKQPAPGTLVFSSERLGELGGVQGILGDHFDAFVKGLSEDERAVCARLVEVLVTPTRFRVPCSPRELVDALPDTRRDPDGTDLLAKMAQARLVRSTPDARLQVAHAAFATAMELWVASKRTDAERAERRARINSQRIAWGLGGAATVLSATFAAMTYLHGATTPASQDGAAVEEEKLYALVVDSLVRQSRELVLTDPERAAALARGATALRVPHGVGRKADGLLENARSTLTLGASAQVYRVFVNGASRLDLASGAVRVGPTAWQEPFTDPGGSASEDDEMPLQDELAETGGGTDFTPLFSPKGHELALLGHVYPHPVFVIDVDETDEKTRRSRTPALAHVYVSPQSEGFSTGAFATGPKLLLLTGDRVLQSPDLNGQSEPSGGWQLQRLGRTDARGAATADAADRVPVAMDFSGRYIATATKQLVSVQNRDTGATWSARLPAAPVTGLWIAPSGRLAVGAAGGSLVIVDPPHPARGVSPKDGSPQDGVRTATVTTCADRHERVESVAFSGDALAMAIMCPSAIAIVHLAVQASEQAGNEAHARILDPGDDERLARWRSVAISRDGLRVGAHRSDGLIVAWNADGSRPFGERLFHFGAFVAFSPDVKYMLSGDTTRIERVPLVERDPASESRSRFPTATEYWAALGSTLPGLDEGVAQARDGDLDEASDQFAKLLSEHGLRYECSPMVEAIHIRADQLVQSAREAAQAGAVSAIDGALGALESLREELHASQAADAADAGAGHDSCEKRLDVATTKVRALEERALANQIRREIADGKYRKASEDAQKLEAQDLPPEDWNHLCWWGTVRGRIASDVLFACDHAIELAPEELAFVDSHGVAHAVTGDFGKAIADFQKYVARHGEYADERQQWLTALSHGQNPFTDDALKKIEGE